MRAIFEMEMELPETCRACEKAIKIWTPCQRPDGFFNKVCGLTGNNVNRYDNERDLACPLKIVPNESGGEGE